MRGRALLIMAVAGCGRLGFEPGDVTGDGNAPDARVRCTLTDSGPVTVTADGQVIENLHITVSGGPGILVYQFSDVIIRNVEVEYGGAGGEGIRIANSPRARIDNVSVEDVSAPPSGMTAAGGAVVVVGSADVTVTHARMRHGAEHIYCDSSPRLTMQFIEGHDVRRNQNVMMNRCDDALLEDFSFVNPTSTAVTAGDIQSYESSNTTIRRGLLDGENNPSGGGTMFNANGTTASGELVEDVDAIRQGNACFNAWGGTEVTYRRTTCRENICTDQGFGVPASGGIGWSGGGTAGGQVLHLEASTYFQMCGQTYWPAASFIEQELAAVDVPARAPLAQQFCFDP